MTANTLETALDILFENLAATRAREAELAREARKARTQRDALVESIRAAIETLPQSERTPQANRLREAVGTDTPWKRRQRLTERTRIALDWLRARQRPDFHTSELRKHFESLGLKTRLTYLPTLMNRWAKQGMLRQLAHGTYRINRDHEGFGYASTTGASTARH